MDFLIVFTIIILIGLFLLSLTKNKKNSKKQTQTIFSGLKSFNEGNFIVFKNKKEENIVIAIFFPKEHKDFFKSIMKSVKERILFDGAFIESKEDVNIYEMNLPNNYMNIEKTWKDKNNKNIFLNFITPIEYEKYFKDIYKEEFIEQRSLKTKKTTKEKYEDDLSIICSKINDPSYVNVEIPEYIKSKENVLTTEEINSLSENIINETEKEEPTENLTEDSTEGFIDNSPTLEDDNEIKSDLNETESFVEESFFEEENEDIDIKKEQILEKIPEDFFKEAENSSSEEQQKKEIKIFSFQFFHDFAIKKGYVFDCKGRFSLEIMNNAESKKAEDIKLFLSSNKAEDIEVVLKCLEKTAKIFILAGFNNEDVCNRTILKPKFMSDKTILFFHEKEVIYGLPKGIYLLDYPENN